MFQSLAWAALTSLSLTFLMVRVLRPVARRVGLLDRPGGRRKHDEPIPAIGGISMLIALPAATALFLPMDGQLLGLGCGVLLLAAAGVADDLFRLRWPYRLAAQVLAALAVIYLGDIRIEDAGAILGFPLGSLGVLSTPLTVVATVGIVNAFNMADGVDGLAGSLGVVAAALLGAAAMYSGDYTLALALALVVGGLCGFLIYNLRTPWNARARIFLGNAGSEMVGLLIACASFRLTQNPAHPVGVQIAPFFIAPLLIDCMTLMIRRSRSGVSPFHGDRNHLHHMLLDAGLSPSLVVASIASVTALTGAGAALAFKADAPAPLFTAAFVLLGVGYYFATADRQKFVSGVAHLAQQLHLIPEPQPLEPWQLEARAAGRYYRRASDRPVSDAEATPADDQSTQDGGAGDMAARRPRRLRLLSEP
jgi:UDP-GlcNAc:undecaprenyl-phosphate/decaprenyl-phosphate GlcNAc-1-phosphate transferase